MGLLLDFGIENVALKHRARLVVLELDSSGYWCPQEKDVYDFYLYFFKKNICFRVFLTAFEGSMHIFDFCL